MVLINGKRLLKLPEFCEIYNQTRSKLYEMIAAGCGPKLTRIGRRVYVAVDDAEVWIAQFRDRAAS
jgi:predicted DNA-binding transcriptional regulator AlpA